MTRTTFYRWKAKYGGLGPSETKRLKQLEDENRRLKKIVADQTLDMQILKEVIAKKWRGLRHGGRSWVTCARNTSAAPASCWASGVGRCAT